MANVAAKLSDKHSLDALVETTKAAGDRLRAQILRALATESYSVSELCQIFAIAQPAMSHHLKVLSTAQLVAKRREGNSFYYRRATAQRDTLNHALFDAIDQAVLPRAVGDGVARVHADRHQRSADFFAQNAHRFADQQALVAQASTYAGAVAEVIDNAGATPGKLLEVGPGTAELLDVLATRFDEVVGIDSSPTMLKQTAERTAEFANVTLREQDFFAVPTSRRYDAVVAAMVVHHMPSPQRFFKQAHRIIKVGGLLVVAELCRHDNDWVTKACGDTWLGFEPQELEAWAAKAGFTPTESQFLGQNNGFQIQIHGFRRNRQRT